MKACLRRQDTAPDPAPPTPRPRASPRGQWVAPPQAMSRMVRKLRSAARWSAGSCLATAGGTGAMLSS